MRIAIPASLPGTALDNITLPVVKWLSKKGHDITYKLSIPESDSFDLVHFSNPHGSIPDNLNALTLQVNHIEVPKENKLMFNLLRLSPARVVVSDRFWQQRLGMYEIPNVVKIPLTFDHSRFQPLPYPDKFTLGWLGTDWPYKRFDIARAAAKDLGIPFVDGSRKDKLESESPTWDPDPLVFHRKISCYIVTTFTDTGPLPPQEALLCNRPVITTTVGMMPDIIKSGWNGQFYNGSIEGLKETILHVKENFDRYSASYQHTLPLLPTVDQVASKFEALFEEVIAEAA